MKNDNIINILEKVLNSSSSVKNEDLQKFLLSTSKLTPEEIIHLFLKVEKTVSEEELKRIFSYLPENNQEFVELLLQIGSIKTEEEKKLYNLYKETKKELAQTFKNRFLVYSSNQEQLTQYVNSLSDAELAHILSALKEEDKTSLNLRCIEYLQILNANKKK